MILKSLFSKLIFIQPMVLVVLLSMSFSVGSQSQPQVTSLQPDRDTIVIARVSTNPKKHYKHLKPLADYLAENLNDLGIKQGKIVFAENNQQMIDLIRLGKVDVISETVFSATLFSEVAAAEIMLRRWKKGIAEYSSVIFTRKESGIKSLSDLQGKVIAFQDCGSSSAYYIPASILVRDGYELYPLDSPRESPPANKIGYVFADKEINISAWVHNGIVDAGAFSNINWDQPVDMPPKMRKNLEIIYQSILFPRSLELVRRDMHPLLKERIKDVLLTAHENEQGRKALAAYQKTKKYDTLNGTSWDSIKFASELLPIMEYKQ